MNGVLPDWAILLMASILALAWATSPAGTNDAAAWALGVLTLPAASAVTRRAFMGWRAVKRRRAHRQTVTALHAEQEAEA